LEEVVARIDTPRLLQFDAAFFNDIDFDTPELVRFAGRTSTFNPPNKADVSFDGITASLDLQPQASRAFIHFQVYVICRKPNWQLSSVTQICTTFLPLLSTTENLFISDLHDPPSAWNDGIENEDWLEFLLPFTAVKNLYLPKQFVILIAPVLQEIAASGTTKLLPLQNLYLEGFQRTGPLQKGIAGFISARQLTNRPVAVSVWDKGFASDEPDKADD
jgi:hypothetical protein